MASRTLTVELNKFLQVIFSEEELVTTTRQSYSEARMKLEAEAYVHLNAKFTEGYYLEQQSYLEGEGQLMESRAYKTYKGYRLIAIDSTKYRLPNTKENIREFGLAENNGKSVPMARGSVALDCLNEICVDAILDEYNSSEPRLALRHIEKILKDMVKTIFIMDRGYPSVYFFAMALKLGFEYVIRSNAETFISEFKDFAINNNLKDSIVTIDLFEKYRAGNKQLKQFIDETITQIKVRVVKIQLKDGSYEYLVTSLSQKEFSRGELKEIYNLRWTDETYFNYQKNVLEMENFTGKKPETIRQDFHSKILVSNIATLIANQAEEEIEEELKHSPTEHKYEKYKVNKTVLTGMMKDEIIRMLFLEDDHKWRKHFDYLVKVAKQNKVPVIEDRHFQRKKKNTINHAYLYKRKAL